MTTDDLPAISALRDGLDLSSPDTVTPEEVAAFRRFYTEVKGAPLPAHELLLDLRPDLLKRHRLFARLVGDHENERYPLAHTLMHLHFYVVTGFGDGVLYEAKQARSAGAASADAVDTLGIAYLHAGPRGMASTAAAAGDYLRGWTGEGAADRFPSHWHGDVDVLSAGLDYSSDEVLPGELAKIEDWYTRCIGEVPGYVRFLAANRPVVLKAFRNRFEHVVRTLPVQMIPYCLLHLAVTRGSQHGIRENVRLGRHLGLRESELVDVIGWGLLYGGPSSLSDVDALELFVRHAGS